MPRADMQEWTGEAREKYFNHIMGLIYTGALIYDPQQSGYRSGPGTHVNFPDRGTRINCKGASYLMYDLLVHSLPDAVRPESVQVQRAKTLNESRILFPWVPNMKKPLNGPHPPHVQNIGWTFENHYRVRDLLTNKLYDPIFRTVTPNNYDGIIASQVTEPRFEGGAVVVEEVFGEAYRVITRGTMRTLEHLRPAHDIRFTIDDTSFLPEPNFLSRRYSEPL